MSQGQATDDGQDLRDLIERRIDAAEYLRRIERRMLARDREERLHRARRRGFWAGFFSVFGWRP